MKLSLLPISSHQHSFIILSISSFITILYRCEILAEKWSAEILLQYCYVDLLGRGSVVGLH